MGFIIAVIAGFVTPYVETPLARPLAKAMSDFITIDESEMKALSFMIAMLIAGLLCALFNTGSAFGLVLGGTLGYFALQLTEAAKKALDSRKS